MSVIFRKINKENLKKINSVDLTYFILTMCRNFLVIFFTTSYIQYGFIIRIVARAWFKANNLRFKINSSFHFILFDSFFVRFYLVHLNKYTQLSIRITILFLRCTITMLINRKFSACSSSSFVFPFFLSSCG
jgi:hypothetical protein